MQLLNIPIGASLRPGIFLTKAETMIKFLSSERWIFAKRLLRSLVVIVIPPAAGRACNPKQITRKKCYEEIESSDGHRVVFCKQRSLSARRSESPQAAGGGGFQPLARVPSAAGGR